MRDLTRKLFRPALIPLLAMGCAVVQGLSGCAPADTASAEDTHVRHVLVTQANIDQLPPGERLVLALDAEAVVYHIQLDPPLDVDRVVLRSGPLEASLRDALDALRARHLDPFAAADGRLVLAGDPASFDALSRAELEELRRVGSLSARAGSAPRPAPQTIDPDPCGEETRYARVDLGELRLWGSQVTLDCGPPPRPPLWAKLFGDSQDQAPHAVAVDSAGNVAITGSYIHGIDFGGGALPQARFNDAFVAMLDAAGNHLWSRGFPSPQGSYGNGVAIDGAGNVLIAGEFSGTVDLGGGPLTSVGTSSIFLAKLDPAGNHLWSKRFGAVGGRSGSRTIAVDGAGNVILAAVSSGGAIDLGGGPLPSAGDYDALVAKLDPAGNHLWSKRFGDASFQDGEGVAVDASGNVSFVGLLTGQADFGGGVLTSAGQNDIVVVKLDPLGNHLWSKVFGDADDQYGITIASDASGNVVVGGWFLGTVDFGGGPLVASGLNDGFAAMLDASGNHVWSRSIGGGGNDAVISVALDATGNAAVLGSFEGVADLGGGPVPSAGANDIFVAKYDGAGGHVWSSRFGDTAVAYGGVAFDAAGDVYAAGELYGNVDFGSGPMTSAGGLDVFVVKLGP
ncbi:hypothetical protein [Sorangium sp. So ce1153]|uniref:hypothetical protein n=1 Tax=Sorangium sp. So ce1153 TaxID=3133333 RepID=UPI003F63836B